MNNVQVRPAVEDDLAFAFDVTESAMREYVEETWGPWVAEQQRKSHAESFDLRTHGVILVDDVPSGVIASRVEADHVQLEKLYLLPTARNRGVGSVLLQDLIELSNSHRKPLRLRVLAVNSSAQRFYRRHGFAVTRVTPERVFMELSLPNPTFQRTALPPLN